MSVVEPTSLPPPTNDVTLDEVDTPATAVDSTVDDDPGGMDTRFVSIQPQQNLSWKQLFGFIGPAMFVSVGYIDPGNWATDIAGGSKFGYSLLWVLLMSNLMALLLQTLAARLGLATERDLAQLCRLIYPKHICYILWVLCEIAIAATDLAEVLGTAIGLKLLFGMPLLVGVLITAFDTLLFLLIQHFGIRKLELFIFSLLAVISSCFIVELFLAKPKFSEVIVGFIPSLNSESVYIAIGIIGATVMPHNFYLHSSLVLSRKMQRTEQSVRQAFIYNLIDCAISLNLALFVNCSILIVSAAVFYPDHEVTEIEQAHDMLEILLNSSIAPAAFGLGLLCAGQSSTLTGTLAGQIVMEGFVEVQMRPWLRRLLTRCVAIVPAVIVIAVMGNAGTYKLLILSQVILSLQLPFAIIPLIKFSSSSSVMGIYITKLWVNVLAWISAILVIAFNVYMLITDFLMPLFEGGGVYVVFGILGVALSLFLGALLVYLTFRTDSLPSTTPEPLTSNETELEEDRAL